jgi:hypothetical protein
LHSLKNIIKNFGALIMKISKPYKMAVAFLLLVLPSVAQIHATSIDKRGYWIGEDVSHKFDPSLSKVIVEFLLNENAQKVADFGCGGGQYVLAMRNAGIRCQGYDGNPYTETVTGGLSKVQDLSKPFNLGVVYDWIVCLEVGEHIPKQYEHVLLKNIDRHNSKGVVLSWAIKGQGGYGHFNEQNNDYVKEKMKNLGYINDFEAETYMRKNASLSWFKNTVMVFRKPSS